MKKTLVLHFVRWQFPLLTYVGVGVCMCVCIYTTSIQWLMYNNIIAASLLSLVTSLSACPHTPKPRHKNEKNKNKPKSPRCCVPNITLETYYAVN
ncbi:hypothetical protein COCSADRAFT_336562 [Bipolaris sorokiniana ND90Pr]|uniref:Uncharacterized protein n=1 Tax=Cochliobolus sativus (strain ND90Pr / ATCC 201652) TaxID=665912 RepID=M2T1D7_COCSN|nr:uncharacterized protein COCSADRAFT_336562 [Bipolaris sorokiniana ND90Pr]EMD63016.1 hypothetical protein COCSADRAFT_336562 [Bipolaris sorokiniana ND90Pr]